MRKIKIYDALSQSEKLVDDQIIKMYICGPTVYDHIHIGNLRPMIFYDFVANFLRINDYEVKYASNITDIDDKIIKKFSETKLFQSEEALTEFYSSEYLKWFDIFKLSKPDFVPKVSKNIPNIENFLTKIENHGDAYLSNENLIFKISNYKEEYGKLSNINLDKNQLSKKNIISFKETNEDFVLWKKTDFGTNYATKWGKGRPGWHSECACFISEIFQNETISIHGGGIDLKFPHHENERIQFRSATNKELAKIYSYVGHIMVDNQKMSKSLDNFIYVKDIVEKYSPFVIKMFILFSSYKKPLNFSETSILEYEKFYKKILNTFQKNDNFSFIKIDRINRLENEFIIDIFESIENDFNMQNVYTLLVKLLKEINTNSAIDENQILQKNKAAEAFVFVIDFLKIK